MAKRVQHSRKSGLRVAFRIDDEELIGLVSDNARRALMRLGGWIRTTARRSMRKADRLRGKPSEPGSPPKARLGFIKLKVEFAYDKNKKALVVGPEIRKESNRKSPRTERGVPNLMEFGGEEVVGPKGWWIFTWKGSQKITTLSGRVIRQAKLKDKVFLKPGTRMRFPARPFMRPAFAKAQSQEKLKSFWEAL